MTDLEKVLAGEQDVAALFPATEKAMKDLEVALTNWKSLQIGVRLLHDRARMPTRAHPTDAGWDITSDMVTTLYPGEVRIITTGVALDIPRHWQVEVRPRSGLAFKHGITVLNAPGTIDAGYQGEIKIALVNHGKHPYSIVQGDRVAQLVLMPVPEMSWVQVTEAPAPSARGEAGFGSSGRT